MSEATFEEIAKAWAVCVENGYQQPAQWLWDFAAGAFMLYYHARERIAKCLPR